MAFSAATSEDFEMIDHREVNLDPEDLAKLQGWLQPTDYTADSSEFRRHLSSQAPGTGLWICNTARYQQWHQSDGHSSLWVKGVPGAGKSVIAASMVEHLSSTEDVPVLYFFFRYIVAANRKPRNLIQDFLAQLLPRCPRLQGTLQPLLGSELDHLSDERLWEFLLLGLASIEKTYCVVDAMDEMELGSNDTFLQRLNGLATFRPESVKLFMTSRPKQYLQSALHDASIVHISLEDDLVGKDIAVFVAHRLKDVLSGDENAQLRASLESTICERSRGLFLYARLLVDQIIPKLHATGQLDVQKLAKSLPIGLEDMYNTMLYQNTESEKITTDIQVFLLEFVTHSSRALRLNELANVLASEFPSERLPGTPKNVARTACAPLLEILEDETVQVIHHSFTEFLLDTERTKDVSNDSTPQFPVLDPPKVHKRLAMVSLKYLQSGVLRHPDAEEFEKASKCDCDGDFDCRCRRGQKKMEDPYDYQEARLRYPFLEYAIKNWAYHCHRYDADDEDFLQAVSSFMDPKSLDFRQWLRLEWTRRQVPGAAQTPAPLHVAAFAGMSKYAARLLRDGQIVDPLDADQLTPLHWACRRGHVEIATLLLQGGADANAHSCRGVVPLHEAAKRNHSTIVKLLLDAGVDPIATKTKENHGGRLLGGERSTKGETAIEYACQQGHLDTITVMLPYLKPASFEEVLGRACRCGEFEIVKAVLLNTDVSPNTRFEGGTPLYVAATGHNTSIVEILLSKEADPLEMCDYQPNYRINGAGRRLRAGPMKAPIHALVHQWNESTHVACQQILNMLSGAGANIDAKNGEGNTPLLSLFDVRHAAPLIAVKSLLEAGADVSAVDRNGDSVLFRALQNCKNVEIIKLLLDLGARPDARGSKGETALHQILSHPHGNIEDSINEIILLLLEKGVRPDLKNDFGRTALESAILTATCTLKTFKLLLNKCDNTAAQGCMWLLGSRKTIEETKQFIELLLSHGASLEGRSKTGKTPILADLRNQKAVKALRQLGADIYAVDNHGRGILHCFTSIMGGHTLLDVFLKYVGYGLDPLVVDNEGNSILHVAVGNFEGTARNIEFIKYLLEAGISMNARNKEGETPLMVNVELAHVHSSSNEKRVSLLDIFRRHEQKEKLDLNAQDNDGLAAIHLATLRSEFELFSLLSAGADPTLVTKEKRTILHLACRARQTNTIALIIDKCKELINTQDQDGLTPLHDACTSGRPESVFCLLQAGASVDLTDDGGRTPLHACATFPIEQNIWSLLEHRNHYGSPSLGSTLQEDRFRPKPGRGYEDKPWYSTTYMSPRSSEHDTCRVGPIIEMLIEAGANPFALDSKNRFPLDLAVANDCKEMIAKLAFTHENIIERWDIDEKARNKLPTLLAIKTASGLSTLDHLDEVTRKEVLSEPRTWMGMLDYPSLCSWVKEHKEELANDTETTSKILHEAASEGLTELIASLDSLVALNDDPSTVEMHLKKNSERTHPSRTVYDPVLQIASSRISNNLPLIHLLVDKCNIDINARSLAPSTPYTTIPNILAPGSTALHILARTRSFWQLQAIRYLVSAGANINAVDEIGQTPLHIASKGDEKTNMGSSQAFWTSSATSILLELGADPNVLDYHGLSCLHKASSSPEIMKALLEHGADLNMGKLSPLFSAIQSQDLKALEILLDAGADANSVDEKKGFRVHYRIKGQIRYALFCACFPGLFNQQPIDSAPLVKLLLKRGADPYVALSETETLIHFVVEHAEEEIVFSFFNPEIVPLINWEAKDQLGRTVLLAAANWTECLQGYRHKHWFEKVKAPVIRLLDLDVDSLAKDNEGSNCLHHLCANEDMEEDAILQFLAHPASLTLISQPDKKGYKPLHLALSVLRPKIVERILELGKQEDLLSADPTGKTALHHIAAQCLEVKERQRVSHLTENHSPDYYPGLCSLWQKFLSLGGDIDARDTLGNTPLFTFLSSPEKDVQRKEEEEACHVQHLDTFFKEADIRTRNKDGETVLHVVANRTGSGEEHDKALFAVFVKRGLDPLMEDGRGRTALDVAAARGKGAILEMFERGGRS